MVKLSQCEAKDCRELSKCLSSHKTFCVDKTRSSHQRCSVRKGVLLQALACNFIKKETLAQVFSCEYCEISKNTFLAEHLRQLLLENQEYRGMGK